MTCEQASDEEPRGQREERKNGELAEQDVRDLPARKPEDSKARELSSTLRESDAGVIVDNAKRDRPGENGVEEREDEEGLREGFVKPGSSARER